MHQSLLDQQAASPAIRSAGSQPGSAERWTALLSTAGSVRRRIDGGGAQGTTLVRRRVNGEVVRERAAGLHVARSPGIRRRALAAGGLIACAAAGLAPVVVHAPVAAAADSTSDALLFARVNQDRTSNGVGALQYYGPLGTIAESGNYGGCGFNVRGRAQDMIDRNYFSHPILGCGQYVFSMMSAAGIGYQSAGENIGWNNAGDQGSAVAAIDVSFMNSPEHRANILDPRFTHVGLGSANSGGATWNGGSGTGYQNVSMFTEEFAQLPGVAGSTPPSPPPPPPDTSPLPDGAVAVVGGGRQPFSFTSAGYTALGGSAWAAPTVVSAPGMTLYVVTGDDHALYVRNGAAGWRPLSATQTWCQGSPAATVTGSTLVVACAGSDGALWTASGPVAPGGLPVVANWTSLGGVLTAGPGLATVGGRVTYVAAGLGGQVWFRTRESGYVPTGWQCIGQPALGDSGGTAYFGCHGTDQGLWTSHNSGGGWTHAESAGGRVVDGVGVAPGGTTGARYFVIGVNGDLWQANVGNDGSHSYIRRGGDVFGGAGAGGY